MNLRDRITHDGKDYEIAYISDSDNPKVISLKSIPPDYYVNASGERRVGDVFTGSDGALYLNGPYHVHLLGRIAGSARGPFLLVRDGKLW